MDRVVRAIDVGFGYTKYTTTETDDGPIRCAMFSIDRVSIGA